MTRYDKVDLFPIFNKNQSSDQLQGLVLVALARRQGCAGAGQHWDVTDITHTDLQT